MLTASWHHNDEASGVLHAKRRSEYDSANMVVAAAPHLLFLPFDRYCRRAVIVIAIVIAIVVIFTAAFVGYYLDGRTARHVSNVWWQLCTKSTAPPPAATITAQRNHKYQQLRWLQWQKQQLHLLHSCQSATKANFISIIQIVLLLSKSSSVWVATLALPSFLPFLQSPNIACICILSTFIAIVGSKSIVY